VPPIDERIDALQRRNNTKIGVYAVNLDTGSTVAHLDGESFAMCSTFKGYAAARVLQMVQQGELTLDRQIYVDPKQTALPNSPRTAPNSGGQMTLAELCAAAVQVSDNAAANLVLQTIGGPSAITDFARSIGDPRYRAIRATPARRTRWATATAPCSPETCWRRRRGSSSRTGCGQ
jgi:beta-lactamase class A